MDSKVKKTENLTLRSLVKKIHNKDIIGYKLIKLNASGNVEILNVIPEGQISNGVFNSIKRYHIECPTSNYYQKDDEGDIFYVITLKCDVKCDGSNLAVWEWEIENSYATRNSKDRLNHILKNLKKMEITPRVRKLGININLLKITLAFSGTNSDPIKV